MVPDNRSSSVSSQNGGNVSSASVLQHAHRPLALSQQPSVASSTATQVTAAKLVSQPSDSSTTVTQVTAAKLVSQPSHASSSKVPVSDPFLAKLIAVCSAKPVELPLLSQQLRELARSSASFFQRQGTPLPEQVLRRCVQVLASCIDTLLQPVVSQVERELSHQKASSSHDGANWATVDFDYFKGALTTAALSAHAQPLTVVGAQAGVLLDLLRGLHSLESKNGTANRNVVFQVRCV